MEEKSHLNINLPWKDLYTSNIRHKQNNLIFSLLGQEYNKHFNAHLLLSIVLHVFKQGIWRWKKGNQKLPFLERGRLNSILQQHNLTHNNNKLQRKGEIH